MAKELGFRDLIDEVRVSSYEEQDKTTKVKKSVDGLVSVFKDFFDLQKQQALDNLESDRESGGSDKGGKGGGNLPSAKDDSDKSFLWMIGSILGAVTGLVVGMAEGFGRAVGLIFKGFGGVIKLFIKGVRGTIGLITRGFNALMGLGVDGKPTTKTSKLVKDMYKMGKNFTKSISRGVKFITTPFTNFATRISNIGSGLAKSLKSKIIGVRRSLTNGLTKVTNVFKSIGNFLKGGANKVLGGVTKAMTGAKNFFKGLPGISRFFTDVGKLGKDVKGLAGATKGAGGASKIFGTITKSIRGVFGTIKSMGGGFMKFFSIFRTLGRVIFFPLTIIMTIVDAITGFKDGFASSGGSMIGGILGAVSGVLIGLIGMPLDLLKSAVGWIAGKMGFENFAEMLEGFSFSEMIGNLFGSITDTILGFMDGIKEDFATMSFAGAIGEMGKKLFNIVSGILKFPLAVAAGAANAVASVFNPSKGAMEAFNEGFSAVMKAGTFETNTASKVEGRKENRAEFEANEAEKERVSKLDTTPREGATERVDEGSTAQAPSAPVIVNNVDASSNNNSTNSSSQQSYVGEPSPSFDMSMGNRLSFV